MPKGKKQSNEEIIEILQRYKAMGGGFSTLAESGEDALINISEIQNKLRNAKRSFKKTLNKLRKAEEMLSGKTEVANGT
jgi:hypothetical protein